MRRRRLVAVAFALVLPGLGLGRFVDARKGSGAGITLRTLPGTVGPWSMQQETRLSIEELEMLRPDEYVARTYAAAGRVPVWLYVAVYSEGSSDDRGAHDPAVCYPAQGWEVLGTRTVEVSVPGGERFVGTLFTAHKGRAEQKVLYWFQPAGRWPKHQSREQLTRIWDAVTGRPQYAFVRLAVPSAPGSEAERQLEEFAGEIGWPIRLALVGESGKPEIGAGAPPVHRESRKRPFQSGSDRVMIEGPARRVVAGITLW